MRIHTRTIRAMIGALGVLLAPAALAAQDVAIRNATIITISNGDIQNGNDRRSERQDHGGRHATWRSRPAFASIDGTGKFVMPGIIDAHSHAALENGINEGSESVTPEVQVELKNDDPVIYRALAGGVTAANHAARQREHDRRPVARHQDALGHAGRTRCTSRARCRIVKFALGENVTHASATADVEDERFPDDAHGRGLTSALLVHEGEGVRQGRGRTIAPR